MNMIVKHSRIELHGYEVNYENKIEKMFSVYDKIYHQRFLKGVLYDDESKKLIIPRGVDINFISNIVNCQPYMDYKHDPYDKVDIKMKYLPRDDVQKKALAFLCGAKSYEYTKNKSQLVLALNTGKGKTYCSIAASCILGLKEMVITSSIDWLEQWKACILEYTDTKPDEIYMFVGAPSINRAFNRDMSKYKFILASHDTIKSYGDKFGWDKIDKLFKHCKIGIKVFDEAHLNFDNMAKIDFNTNTMKTFYVSATPSRSDEDEKRIFSYYLKNVPKIDLFDENIDPHTDYIAMRYSSRPSGYDISDCRNRYGFDKNKYSMYVSKKDNLYYMLDILIDIALNNKGKNVFYVATTEAIGIIKNRILQRYPFLVLDIGEYHNKVDPSIKQSQLDKRIILSTTKSLGTARDIKGLKMVVVLAEPFKSDIMARQSLGRTRDDKTVYIEVVDYGFSTISSYCREKRAIFEKYAKSVSDITLKDNELFAKADRARTRILSNANIACKFYTSLEEMPEPVILQQSVNFITRE